MKRCDQSSWTADQRFLPGQRAGRCVFKNKVRRESKIERISSEIREKGSGEHTGVAAADNIRVKG